MKTLKTLQSNDAVLAVLVLALLAQMPHAQHVFYEFSKDLGWFGLLQSWFAAVALEFAVLVFVVRSKIIESWGFAAFSVAINIVYYYDPVVAWWVPKATWLLSAGLPVAIALYSHEVASKHGVYALVGTGNRPQPDVNIAVNTVLPEIATVNIAKRAAQLLSEYDNNRCGVVNILFGEGHKQVDIATAMSTSKTQVSRWIAKGKTNVNSN